MARNRNVRVYSVPGEMGPQPAYEWEGTKVRFTQPSGKWGEWVDLVGMKGASAFDLAKSFGFEGSEDEWLASLKGAKGDAGENGLSVYQLAVKNGFKGTVREYLDHIKVVNGKDGLSAYQVAVKNGFEGSESEWLASLQGDKGDDGLSAYEVWLALGNRGSENDFFDWLAEKVRRLVKNIDDKGAGPLRIKLSMLTDVDVSGADENDVLTFIDGEWVAAPSSGGGGGVQSVEPGRLISVDSSDPNNPIVNVKFLGQDFDYMYVYDGSIYTSNNISFSDAHGAIYLDESNVRFSFKFNKDVYGTFDTSGLTDPRTVSFQDADGTMAYLSDIPDISGLVSGTGTINQITYWTGSNSIGSLDTTTYPSLTELSYVKGVTSSIQSQINIARIHSKAVCIESPTNAEDVSLFFTDRAITITKIAAVLVGSSTPSVTWTIRYEADRSAAGTQVVTGGTTTTSITTGSVVTSFSSAAIPANSYIWLETTAQSGTVDSLNVTIIYEV